MDTIAKQKALADRVYALLVEDYDVLLAGGAPRDWYIGQAARDLDFYVYSENPEKDLLEISERLGVKFEPLADKTYEDLWLQGVLEGGVYGQKVQFMFVSVPPLELVKEHFDLSICKVWYKDGEICMDWEARLSFRENIIVMKDGFNKHADKLMQRDPWGNFAFMGSWRRALDLIAEMTARPFEEAFEDLAVEWGNVNLANEVAMPGRRRRGLLFEEGGQVPDPQANEVAF